MKKILLSLPFFVAAICPTTTRFTFPSMADVAANITAIRETLDSINTLLERISACKDKGVLVDPIDKPSLIPQENYPTTLRSSEGHNPTTLRSSEGYNQGAVPPVVLSFGQVQYRTYIDECLRSLRASIVDIQLDISIIHHQVTMLKESNGKGENGAKDK